MKSNFVRFLIFFFVFSLRNLSFGNEYSVAFGLLKQVDNKYYLAKETNIIPYVTKSDGQIFGFVIRSVSGLKFSFYSVAYLPKPPKLYTGDTAGIQKESIDKGLKSPVYKAVDGVVHTMWLDEGDPSGNYKVEIYINDKLIKTVPFEVKDKVNNL